MRNVNAEIIDVGSWKPSVNYSQASVFLYITRKEMHYCNSGFACVWMFSYCSFVTGWTGAFFSFAEEIKVVA